jgi:hypothetical protein
MEREYAAVKADLSIAIEELKSLEDASEQQVGRLLDKIVLVKDLRK